MINFENISTWPTQYTVILLTVLEANSKRPNDFSLIGMKPNEILQFKWKNTYDIKIQTKLKFKSHDEGK